MAKETNLRLFLGEDHQYVFVNLNGAETAAIDMTGWALAFLAKRYSTDTDAAAVITKTTASGIAISGVFNATPATNTQVATVSIADTDTASLEEWLCSWALWRTDANFETPLAFGHIELVRGARIG
jgi:hypothetical protein